MTADELATAPHFVYRLLAADRALLYVGCSVDPVARLAAHYSDQPWADLIAEQTTEGPFSRAEALRREAAAITAECPRFNIAHNLTPERWEGPSDEAFLFVQRRVGLSGRSLMRAFFNGEIPLEPTEADVWLWLRKLDVRYHAYPCYRSCRCGTYWSDAFDLAEDFRHAQEQPGGRPVQGRWANSCEYVVWGSNGPRSLLALDGSALPGFYQANSPRDREHITQKPLSVMRELVKIVPKGGTVLDLFMGAGTTGVAAVLEGRRFIGAELTTQHAVTAERRIVTARQGLSDTCKRGHERNAENSRQRTVNSGGKTRVITECLACAREWKARKAEQRTVERQSA